MFVARAFAGTRSMAQLREHVFAGFRKYGTAAHTASKVARVREWEKKYVEEGVYAEPIDLTTLDPEVDDETPIDLTEEGVNEESDSDEEEDPEENR